MPIGENPGHPDAKDLKERLNRSGVEFLEVDLETALIMARIANEAEDGSDKKMRNIRNARRAYDTIVRLRKRLRPTPEQEQIVEDKLQQLRHALIELGEQFDSM